MKNRTPLILASLALSFQLHGETSLRLDDLFESMPPMEASIASPQKQMHLEIGERHLYNHEIIQYLDYVADVSPRMIALGEHARSHGGRPLVTYAISSPENLANLDTIRETRKDIIDADASVDLTDQPVVMHMGYSIHGNESSGANAVPLLAYYLTAARSQMLTTQLESLVILLSPVFNPDGLDRFAHWTNNHRGLVPSSDPIDREHVEGFPSGRTNYYWFDLNRDWMPHQHPESQGRLKLFHEWKPNVQLDFHEQGSESSYFFMPGKPERTNPLTPAINQKLTNAIADYHRRVFDKDGVLYFSEEGYDDFFIGKGSTYPDLFGCVGILFEQPSSRGIQQDTQNGLLTFPTTISNQFKTSLSSIEAATELRAELLDYQRSFYVDVSKNGKDQSGAYIATAVGDPTRLREFVRVLQGHQIEVELLAEDQEVNGFEYLAGDAITIRADQAQSTYLQALWNRQIEFEENIFYDVSTWTLPLAFNLQHTKDPVKKVSSKALPDGFHSPSREGALEKSSIGYLIDWRDSDSPALLYALLEAEANVRVATRPLRAMISGGEELDFGYGSLFVSKALNESIPTKAVDLLNRAWKNGAPVYSVGSSSTSSGIDMGSRDFKVLKLPKVLLATGPGMRPYDVGEIWHLLDQRIEMPVTMVETNRLEGVDLRNYTHILLVNGLSSMTDSGVGKLKDFASAGGIIWGQGDGTVKWLVDKEFAKAEWRKTAEEKAREALEKKSDGVTGKNADSKKSDSANKPKSIERRPYADARDEAAFKLVRGAIFGTSLDVTHPIGYGYSSEFLPVFRRSSKFIEPSLNAYSTPVLYEEAPLLSGYVSDDNLETLSGSASLVVAEQGRGAIVLSLDDPNFRAFWWGTQRLMVNAIFFGDLLETP